MKHSPNKGAVFYGQERRKNVPKTTGENEEGTGVLGNKKKGRANLSNREREEQRT